MGITHWHVHVIEPNGQARLGALSTTSEGAELEAQIEKEGQEGKRAVTIEDCTSDCFGKHMAAA
jgi:uncharacterized metal-binding protein